MKIQRYYLNLDRTEISMPVGAKIFWIGECTQERFLFMDVIIDDSPVKYKVRVFQTRGPGAEIKKNMKYIGTTNSISVIFHVFEEI